MEALCGFSKVDGNFGVIGDWVGQLGDVENTAWEGSKWNGL
jgi:hypothetical protein